MPQFRCKPPPLVEGGDYDWHFLGPQHQGTIHFETKMEEIEHAYREASCGIPATKPVVEMTIPSAVDETLGKRLKDGSDNGEWENLPIGGGYYVAQLFVQFAPYDLDPKVGSWADPEFKRQFVEDHVFKSMDAYLMKPMREILVNPTSYDALSPLDLERIFSLHKGNIFHGSMSLHQLAYARPVPGFADHRTPVENLYICGSGAHPGGGVMGAPGRNCARVVLSDIETRG